MSTPFLNPNQQWKQDEAARVTHQQGARKSFRALLPQIQDVAEIVNSTIPIKHNDPDKLRKTLLGQEIRKLSDVTQFTDDWIGDESIDKHARVWRNAVPTLFRDVVLGTRGIRETLNLLDNITSKGFQAQVMHDVQRPLRTTLPEQLRAFLPPNIVVDVDDDGTIRRVTDRFTREHKTMGEKIRRMRLIVKQYNTIVRKVKADLSSGDEVVRMSALITAILMETGIRPGRAGNHIVEVIAGEEVEVETFGAITLGPNHVRFIRDNFIQLDFVGKAGTKNTAVLSDRQIVQVLQDFVEKAQASGSKFIFTTKDGRQFTNGLLNGYFNRNFKDIAPTDFRKLRATEVILRSLREGQATLYGEIRKFVSTEADNLSERVVDAIVATVDRAITEAQRALSHDSGADVTRDNYINPEILLQFFSTGKAAESLEAAILDGKTTLAFDPMTFVSLAMKKAFSKSATLRDLLTEIEDQGLLL